MSEHIEFKVTKVSMVRPEFTVATVSFSITNAGGIEESGSVKVVIDHELTLLSEIKSAAIRRAKTLLALVASASVD